MRRFAAGALLLIPLVAAAQDTSQWTFRSRFELRANLRDSNEERFPLRFPFPLELLPVGQTVGFLETVNSGRHAEISVVQLRLDAAYGDWFAAHAQIHAQDKYRRNPTSEDRQTDADELWLRFGPKPDFLERPRGTSVFLQMGKFPHPERQPIRLLESYGLAATAFNRFEDVGYMAGGSVGRNLYWRITGTSGNPLFFRDTNALAGDNGIKELLQLHPDPRLKSGFPILYNSETEGYFLKTGNIQWGGMLGYRWQNEAQTLGFDAIAFHYRRSMPFEEHLTGTFYGADIDLLDGPDFATQFSLPIHGNRKQEDGARVYSEFHKLTAIAQFTKQQIAGLHRQGEELEVGYQFERIQPAVRWSGLQNFFKGPPQYPSPSVWWNWVKIDYGVRVNLIKSVDLTIERAKHNIAAPRRLNLSETLVTLRVRI